MAVNEIKTYTTLKLDIKSKINIRGPLTNEKPSQWNFNGTKRELRFYS